MKFLAQLWLLVFAMLVVVAGFGLGWAVVYYVILTAVR